MKSTLLRVSILAGLPIFLAASLACPHLAMAAPSASNADAGDIPTAKPKRNMPPPKASHTKPEKENPEAFTSLDAIVSRAVSNSDALRAQQQSEHVSEAQEKVAETGYLPTVSADAIYSTGFPGSTSLLGVTGAMGSPYRQGFAVGLSASETLWDFGITHSKIFLAEKQTAAQKTHTEVSHWNVQREAINLFYSCAHAQTEADLWGEINSDSQEVQKEVDRFVHTGQRSVVDGLLAKAQTDEASRNQSTYAEQVAVLHQRLQVLTGMKAEGIRCPNLFSSGFTGAAPSDSNRQANPSLVGNPYVRQAEAENEVADAQVSQARTGNRPRLNVVGSVGDLTHSRLVEKKDYAVGVGMSFPFFDGLRTPREVDKALAYKTQKEEEIGAAHQYVDDANLRFDQLIRSDRVAIDHLQQELADSDKAFRLARQRYLSLSGNLVDVRESIRNYSRLRAQFVDVQSDWQEAVSLKSAFNGQEL